jgi:ribonuclease E
VHHEAAAHEQPAPVNSAPAMRVEPVLAPVAAPVAAPVMAAVATPPAAPVRIEPFALPTDALHALAADAGLQWVNSDAEKIRQVQAAMAAEPKPMHMPREPRLHVLVDDGPLVLVETRRDLSQQKLPFDVTHAD